MKIRILPLLALLLLPLCAGAAEVESGVVYCFSQADFSLSEEPLTGVFFTDVPEAAGSVMLGSRKLRAGDAVPADRLAEMTFSPAAAETDGNVMLEFLPVYAGNVGAETTLTFSVRGKENKPPVAENSTLETYKNLSNTGTLKVKDPEGEPLTYAVVRQPRRGTVTVAEDGTFTYTPKKNKVGIDSFTFTAADASGKTSREATVTVTILKPTDSTRYTDTAGNSCCFAAEWMKNTGIFVGEQIGGNACFSPEKSVSRGEFVTMLVKTLNLPVEEDVTQTGFTDVPQWLRPYLAAAARAGLILGNGENTFRAEETMAPEDAAIMVSAVLRSDGTLEDAGLWSLTGDSLTRGETARLLYSLSVLTNQENRPEVLQ